MISHNKYIYFAYQNITKIDDVMKYHWIPSNWKRLYNIQRRT